MHARWLAVAIFAILLGTPQAASQAEKTDQSHRVVFSDAEGDVFFSSFDGQNVTRISATHPHLDVLAGWVSNETETEFEVGYRLKRWEEPTPTHPGLARVVRIGFAFDNRSYVILHGWRSQCTETQAVLAHGSADTDGWSTVGCLNATVNTAAAEAHVLIGKRLVKNHVALTPQIGDSIRDLVVVAKQLLVVGWANDRAPDSGFAGPFSFRRGQVEREGDIFLQAAVPIRASNGESTTMVFKVKLGNDGSEDHVATLTADESNPDWTVRLPPRLRVGPGKQVEFPVILSMNFSHQHGITEHLSVRAESLTKPGQWARTQLGVHWLEIPQPAGHHDKLWLHSGPAPFAYGVTLPHEVIAFKSIWMNPVETDPTPGTTDEEVAGWTLFPVVNNMDVRWGVPLRPALQIGIDVDESRAGTFETRIKTTVPATRATLTVALYYCDASGQTPGATGTCGRGTRVDVFTASSNPEPLAANAEKTYALELKPNLTAGLVPFEPGRNLILAITLRADTPQGAYLVFRQPSVVLLPKFSHIVLPLFEYHDPIDQAFTDIGTIHLQALDPFEKQVNPGRNAIFRFDLTNTGQTTQDLRLSAEGINSAWARIHEGTSLRLQSRELRQATLVVEAPEDAQPGERAELFFVAESVKDPSIVTLARIRATVVDVGTLDVPDETPSISDAVAGGTSSLGFGSVAASLTALAIVLRRQRRV